MTQFLHLLSEEFTASSAKSVFGRDMEPSSSLMADWLLVRESSSASTSFTLRPVIWGVKTPLYIVEPLYSNILE